MTGNSSENPVLHVGIVAQLVEQRTENPCVDGSIPPDTTTKRNPANFAGFFVFKVFFKIGELKFYLSKCGVDQIGGKSIQPQT